MLICGPFGIERSKIFMCKSKLQAFRNPRVDFDESKKIANNEISTKNPNAPDLEYDTERVLPVQH